MKILWDIAERCRRGNGNPWEHLVQQLLHAVEICVKPPSILSRYTAFVSGPFDYPLLVTQDTVLGSFFRHISHV
jgi:hypothetical protein